MSLLNPSASSLFDAARAVYEAALDAVSPERLFEKNLSREGSRLRVKDETVDLSDVDRLFLFAVGKAAPHMAARALPLIEDKLAGGVVLTREPKPRREGRLDYLPASHPLPDERSVAAARAILGLAEKAGERDLILLLLSGGGSAQLCLPAEGLSLEDKRRTTDALMKAGAGIGELNTVRKHLSAVKGGRLARKAAPARVLTLVISDVIGNDLGTIASGPTHWDDSTWADARGVLDARNLWESVPEAVRRAVEEGERGGRAETLKKNDPVFARVRTHIIGDIRTALDAAAVRARELGFETFPLTDADSGEARSAARKYIAFLKSLACSLRRAPRPMCFLAGGELTVTVKGKGKGGRNTEFVLAALGQIEKEGLGDLDWLVLSLGTDGIDGPTDAAGAWIDPSTAGRGRNAELDIDRFLDDNDSYSYFEKTGGLIVTGPTPTNVMDLRLFLIG
jgi:glycerate 2-kinase